MGYFFLTRLLFLFQGQPQAEDSEERLEDALLETEDKEDAVAAKLLKQEQVGLQW